MNQINKSIAYVEIICTNGKSRVQWAYRNSPDWTYAPGVDNLPKWIQERIAVLILCMPDNPLGKMVVGNEMVDRWGQTRTKFRVVKQDE